MNRSARPVTCRLALAFLAPRSQEQRGARVESHKSKTEGTQGREEAPRKPRGAGNSRGSVNSPGGCRSPPASHPCLSPRCQSQDTSIPASHTQAPSRWCPTPGDHTLREAEPGVSRPRGISAQQRHVEGGACRRSGGSGGSGGRLSPSAARAPACFTQPFRASSLLCSVGSPEGEKVLSCGRLSRTARYYREEKESKISSEERKKDRAHLKSVPRGRKHIPGNKRRTMRDTGRKSARMWN